MEANFAPMIGGTAGMMILVYLLPIVGAVSVGLVYVGILRRRLGLLLVGIAFPLAVLAAGSFLREFAINAPGMPEGYAASLDLVTSSLPIALLIAAAIFLVGVLPTMVRVTLKR